jgi:hypothetical protein
MIEKLEQHFGNRAYFPVSFCDLTFSPTSFLPVLEFINRQSNPAGLSV